MLSLYFVGEKNKEAAGRIVLLSSLWSNICLYALEK